jgi:hypothetical protein
MNGDDDQNAVFSSVKNKEEKYSSSQHKILCKSIYADEDFSIHHKNKLPSMITTRYL